MLSKFYIEYRGGPLFCERWPTEENPNDCWVINGAWKFTLLKDKISYWTPRGWEYDVPVKVYEHYGLMKFSHQQYNEAIQWMQDEGIKHSAIRKFVGNKFYHYKTRLTEFKTRVQYAIEAYKHHSKRGELGHRYTEDDIPF